MLIMDAIFIAEKRVETLNLIWFQSLKE